MNQPPTVPAPPSAPPSAPSITTKTYQYQKSYVTKSGEIRYCTQTVTARVSGRRPGRPKKITITQQAS